MPTAMVERTRSSTFPPFSGPALTVSMRTTRWNTIKSLAVKARSLLSILSCSSAAESFRGSARCPELLAWRNYSYNLGGSRPDAARRAKI